MAFRVLILGGTGQVGAAVVRALAAEPSCAEVVMVNRKTIALTAGPRLRQVILDTAAAQFPAEVAKLGDSILSQGVNQSIVHSICQVVLVLHANDPADSSSR